MNKLAFITTVINLLGEPGAGKSTISAELYAKMKRQRKNVELVREVAKEWAWQGYHIGPFEQLSILGEQIKRESALFGKVDYIITDSPAVLGAFYCSNKGQNFMSNMVYDYYRYSEALGVKFQNYMVHRLGPYDVNGRFETEAQSITLNTQLQDYLNLHEYKFKRVTVMEEILEELK